MRKRLRTLTRGKPSAPQWTFFRQWLKSPLSIAAISPSGRQLASRMLAELPPDTRRVIELGGGTGVFTQALLEYGISPRDLLVLEINEELHHHLQHLFPESHVVCGDARDLGDIAGRSGYATGGPADAVISGLGLLSMPRATQQAILEAAFSLLGPSGRFIQFTYGPGCPVAQEVLDALGLHARRGNLVWWNMPPATVFVIHRNRSRPIAATLMAPMTPR
jgi:phosphatidylethanolamine/phosphatidyl-N-methylethanolamine N-methyltransferase